MEVYIRRVRKKIEQDPDQPEYIQTVRGIGYRFQSPKGAPTQQIAAHLSGVEA